MKNKTIKNVVIYMRVSTEEQTKGHSIDNQRRELETHCKLNGYEIIKEFVDAGISGTTMEKREDFKSMLRTIETRSDIDAVLIWKLSRISRNTKDTASIVDFLKKNDIALIATADHIDTSTPMGSVMANMAGIFAEMERDNIVEYAKGGMRERARQGKSNGGPPPIGYDRDSEGNYVINEKEAQTVQLIFNLYVESNWGYSRICTHLNNQLDMHSTKKGNEWAYSTVKAIIDNPVYVGMIRWGVHADWDKKRRKGTTTDYILADGCHQGIISQDMWDSVIEKRKRVGKGNEKKYEYSSPLSGIVKCPECGSSMIIQRIQKKTKAGIKTHYRYYGCSYWANHKSKSCRPNLVRADELEAYVLEKIRNLINSPDIAEIISQKLDSKKTMFESETKIRSLEKELTKMKGQQDSYYRYLADPEKLKKLSEDKILDMIASIDVSVSNLESELEHMKLVKLNCSKDTLNVEKIAGMLKNFDSIYNSASEDMKKTLLHSIIKEIHIHPSENIWERKASEILLWFDNQDVLNHFSKEKSGKKFAITCDTVHSSESYTPDKSAPPESASSTDGETSSLKTKA